MVLKRLVLVLLFAASVYGQSNIGGGGTGGGGVVGGTFGGSPSSGYTFTSTPITSAPFQGNLLIGCMIQASGTNTYTAGSGWTIAAASTNGEIGVEYQTAGASSSYSANFSLNSSQVWAGAITAWTATSPAFVQGNIATGANAVAFGSNNTAGNFLYACVRYNTGQGAGPVTSVTDTRSNAWKLAGLRVLESAVKGVGDTNIMEIWYAPNSGAGANTVTANGISTTVGSYISVGEYSGVATSAGTSGTILVDYNYNADGTGNTATTTPAGATTNSQYIYTAVNNKTGNIDYGGTGMAGSVYNRDHAAVFRAASANIAGTGGIIYHKAGVYNGQTAVVETNNSQTTCYVFGIAPYSGTNITGVAWYLLGEGFPAATYATPLSQQGTLFQALPSTYACSEPGAKGLSVMYQRPQAASYNNQVFFKAMGCRVPDNQRGFGGTICYDSYESIYSDHEDVNADTQIAAADQLCGGLTPAVSGMVGYRSNQASTEEVEFHNTWSTGWYTPYNVLSNHPIGVNMHASCNQNAGAFSIATSMYGGQLIHFQDIHNIIGLQLNCSDTGTRFDIQNMIEEWAVSGAFVRTAQASELNAGTCTGKVDVSTGTANGVSDTIAPFFSTAGANFRVTESDRLLLPGLVTSNFTSAATTGTTKQTLATYTFPYVTTGVGPTAGVFQANPGAVFHIKAWGITAANGDSKTVEIDFGGTAIATITSTVNAGAIKCEAEIIVSSVANTQEVMGYCDDGTTRTVTRTAPGITGSAGIALNVAATTGTSSGDFTFKGLVVEYVGGS